MRLKSLGVTLIEALFILVIIGMVLLMGARVATQKTEETRINRTIFQMQQVLNAGLAYYMDKGKWPTQLNDLRNNNYLPPLSVPFQNAWANPYGVLINADKGQFYVFSNMPLTIANIVAGKLPNSYLTAATEVDGQTPKRRVDCTNTSCTVVAWINTPGQNLSNATAVNFVGVYRSGGCVPVPTCPLDKNGNALTPQIYVVPISVKGTARRPYETLSPLAPTDMNTCTVDPVTGYPLCQNLYVESLNSYTAYAKGPNDVSQHNLKSCDDSLTSDKVKCFSDRTFLSGQEQSPEITNGIYWRVCLAVSTESGKIAPVEDTTHPRISMAWGAEMGAVLALVRCGVPNENVGSGFHVWGK